MTGNVERDAGAGDPEQVAAGEDDAQSAATRDALSRSGLGRSVAAGLGGEDISAKGIIDAVGGVRGVIEALLPGLLYLILFMVTGDARVSVLAPAALSIVAVMFRIVQRQSLISSLSGVLGVAIAVFTTLFTGRGEDYFLPGFWINGFWIVALSLSLLLRYPLIGFLVGALTGNLTGWRAEPRLRVAAWVSTIVWLALFALRLVVQLPLYFTGNVTALGLARLAMGVPLFALVILFTWLLFRGVIASRAQSD